MSDREFVLSRYPEAEMTQRQTGSKQVRWYEVIPRLGRFDVLGGGTSQSNAWADARARLENEPAPTKGESHE